MARHQTSLVRRIYSSVALGTLGTWAKIPGWLTGFVAVRFVSCVSRLRFAYLTSGEARVLAFDFSTQIICYDTICTGVPNNVRESGSHLHLVPRFSTVTFIGCFITIPLSVVRPLVIGVLRSLLLMCAEEATSFLVPGGIHQSFRHQLIMDSRTRLGE